MNTTLSENPSYKILYDGNLYFREMCDEHMELKHQVQKLSKSRFLNEEESASLQKIKKAKLELKDKIESILQGSATKE